MTDEDQQNLREALKAVAVALKESRVPFALIGGYAAWARGGPEPDHDVDFLIAEEDADEVESVLAGKGFEIVHPPEDWLFKVFVDDAMVDLLFRMRQNVLTRDDLADADDLEVESVRMPVLGATTLLSAKLGALDERACDLSRILPAARAVREQVDWRRVTDEVSGNPFAEVTLILLERLGVIDGADLPEAELAEEPGAGS
jgi:Uncharacterised nucleotidyltransferase